MTNPRVSVCIRSVHRPGPLRAAIQSVFAQEFADLEVIVSFDGAIPDGFVAGFDDDRLRATRNPGPAGATANLVHAMSLARGELVAMLDDDDAWEPAFLETLVPAFDDERLGVAFCDYVMVAGDHTLPRRWPWPSGRQGSMLVPLMDRSIPPSAALVRSTVLADGNRLLPLAPELAGAATIWLRAAAQGWAFEHVPGLLVRYRLHPHQMSWSADTTAARYAATLDRLTFDDPVAERVRRGRIVEAHLTQAGIHLRRRAFGQARRDLRRARRVGRLATRRNLIAITGIRRSVGRRLAAHPRLLAACIPLWERVRPGPG